MRKNFAVIGLGIFGSSVAEALANAGQEVIAIDKDENVVNAIKDKVTKALILNATDEKALYSIDIGDVDVAIIGVGDIQDSILITLMLKEMGVGNIIAKAINKQHKKVLEKVGATKIILPEIEVGTNLAHSLISTKIFEHIEMSDKYSIIEINPLPRWIGKTIRKADVRNKFNVTIVAIRRKYPHIDEKGEMREIEDIMVSPSPDTEILENDILIIIGDKEAINKLQRR